MEKLYSNIREKYTVKSFSISKDDIIVKKTADRPEPGVYGIIEVFLEGVPSARDVKKDHPEKYKQYPLYLLHELCLANDIFPWNLPIGYVVCSFLLSTKIDFIQIKKIVACFNHWLSVNDNRVKMFESYDKKQFYISKGNAAELDGRQLTDLLYGEG